MIVPDKLRRGKDKKTVSLMAGKSLSLIPCLGQDLDTHNIQYPKGKKTVGIRLEDWLEDTGKAHLKGKGRNN